MKRNLRRHVSDEPDVAPPTAKAEPIPVRSDLGHDARLKAMFERNGYPEARPARRALMGLPAAGPASATNITLPSGVAFRPDDLASHLELHVDLVAAPFSYDDAEKAALLRQVARRYEARSAPTPLPETAPELWKERADKSENPARFTERVYGPWIGRGLTRPALRQLDYPLYTALGVWAHRHPDEPVPHLPTLSEWIDQQVADLADRYSPDDLRKLGLALQKRQLKES